jgi:transcription initiation factor TFIID TATA-box-binding protein
LPQTKALVRIENVVASASVDQTVDLNKITRSFADVEYHPDRFPGLVFRLKVPKTATLIFSSGKMVCTGSKSSEQAVKAVNPVVQNCEKDALTFGTSLMSRSRTVASSLGGRVHSEEAARSRLWLQSADRWIALSKVLPEERRAAPIFWQIR